MVLDSNPNFGRDAKFESDALKVAEMMWGATGGNMKLFPSEYLNHFEHQFSDGTVCMLGKLSKVTFSGKPSYEEYREVVNHLMRVDPEDWAFSESILEIQAEKLLQGQQSFEFSEEFDFASPGDMSDKIELFLKKVIASIYTDGVTGVSDKEGNPPNAQNRYLLSEDGKSFSGIFYDKSDPNNEKEFPFEIRETSGGGYEISY